KNVVRFFFPGDHADAHADVALDPAEKLASVGRLAHRAGRDGDTLVDLPAARDLHHLLQRGHRALDRFVIERRAVETAEAELDHFFFFIDDAIRLFAQLRHDHVDRIRSDVDGRDAARAGDLCGHFTPNLHRVAENS